MTSKFTFIDDYYNGLCFSAGRATLLEWDAFIDDYYYGLCFTWKANGHSYRIRSVNGYSFVDLFWGNTSDVSWSFEIDGVIRPYCGDNFIQELREIFLTIPETLKYYKTIKLVKENFEGCTVHSLGSRNRPNTPFYCFFEAEIKKDANTSINRIDCVVNETVFFEGVKAENVSSTIEKMTDNLNLLTSFNPSVHIYERYLC